MSTNLKKHTQVKSGTYTILHLQSSPLLDTGHGGCWLVGGWASRSVGTQWVSGSVGEWTSWHPLGVSLPPLVSASKTSGHCGTAGSQPHLARLAPRHGGIAQLLGVEVNGTGMRCSCSIYSLKTTFPKTKHLLHRNSDGKRDVHGQNP